MNYLDPKTLEGILENLPEDRQNAPFQKRVIRIGVLAFMLGMFVVYVMLKGPHSPIGACVGNETVTPLPIDPLPYVENKQTQTEDRTKIETTKTGDENRIETSNEGNNIESGPTAVELRLPNHVHPTEYRLKLKTYLPGYVPISADKNLTFDATVLISITVDSPTDKIVLNTKNLNFDMEKTALYEDSKRRKQVTLKEKYVNEEHEKVTFVADRTFSNGQVLYLKVVYSGYINRNISGLYQSAYNDADGNPKIAAATQMEPIDARQLVPCLDEPDYKAKWLVTVVHPQGTRALSNGKEIETNTNNDDFDYLETNFKPTPPMSSYLLAVIVSEFEYIEETTSNGVRFRIYARPEAIETARYALEAGIHCLTYYEKWFNISFPLEKQDMVALPDFASGAMENWGLITYREKNLLFNDSISTSGNKARVAEVIAHELAHMWFGNLVTMQWWDDLWLNEGFASFVEMFGLEHIYEQEGILLQAINELFTMDFPVEEQKKINVIQTNTLPSAKEADSYATSHPLSFKIDQSKEVQEAFDGISYGKGACIMNMLREVMGPKNFDEGITTYLNKNAYNNAKAADLWISLNKHTSTSRKGPDGSRLDIPKFASQWTDQMGFPMLTVDRVNATTVKISQKRFLKNSKTQMLQKYANPDYGYKWDVPVWYYVAKNPTMQFAWLRRDSDLYVTEPNGMLIVNAGGNGFYRHKYGKSEWKTVVNVLRHAHTKLDAHTRANLVADAFEMAAIGEMDYSDLFEMLEYAKKEKDPVAEQALISGIWDIISYYGNEPETNQANALWNVLKEDEVRRFKSMYSASEKLNRKLERFAEKKKNLEENEFYQDSLDVSAMEVCSGRRCFLENKERFEVDFLSNCSAPGALASHCNKIAPGKRGKVYCFGVENSDGETFKTILSFYKRERNQQERLNLLKGLTCTRNPRTLKSLLLASMNRNSDLVRFQDVPTLFGRVAQNSVGKELMFNFFQTHWEQIYDSFSSRTSIINALISYAAGTVRTPHQLNKLIHMRDTAPHAREYYQFTKVIDRRGHVVQWNLKYGEKVLELIQKTTHQ